MRLTIIISLMSALSAGTAASDLIAPDVSELRLRAEARVSGAAVTLADVLDFSQADARLREQIGGEPAFAETLKAPLQTTFGHDQAVARLSALGVNMSRVLVSGALTCRVTLAEREAETAGGDSADEASPLLRARSQPAGTTTLADKLREFIQNELQEKNGTIEIEFEHAGREFLELTTPPFDFTIRAERGRKLGLREFCVTLMQDGRVQRTVTIGGRISLTKPVLVAAKPLSIGTYIRRDSLETGARIFTQDEDFGIEYPEQAVGQKVKNFVPAGQMVRASDLKTVDLVRRSQPVTVTGSVAGSEDVDVRITGDALDSGGYGDTVRVRLGDSRKNYREIRGVVVGVGTVRLAEGNL
jgi:flagella basal body P-ring formation protein FlgA